MASEKLRQQISWEAARLMYLREESEYYRAKLKAARRICRGWVKPKDLPSNAEIREQIQLFARLHEGERRTANLKDMRLAALALMRKLRRFKPRLIGSVMTGHVRQGSDIDLHVFADSVSPITEILEAEGLPLHALVCERHIGVGLSVRDIEVIDPDPKLYPDFDGDLRKAFATEMDLFADSILRDEGRSVVELLTAPYTFVNERLARHYGIPGVLGDRFRRVELRDPNRWGVLGKGSVLLATSYPDRTSPVLRGAWVMEHLLGVPPTPPPPGVETNLAASTETPRSVRERLALHRTQSSCNHCHGVIDPLGQALENYNAVGEWRVRERDSGAAVDATGQLADGRTVASPTDLRKALAAEPEKFVQTVVQQHIVVQPRVGPLVLRTGTCGQVG